MYRCGVCSTVSKSHEPANHLVLRTRMAEYPERPDVYQMADGTLKADPGGRGTQIVSETIACKSCFDKATYVESQQYQEV